jgi:invasion protein IalB
MIKRTLFPLLAALAVFLPVRAQAAPELIGLFDDWEAYTATEAGAKICYMGSEPEKMEGNYSKRGRVVMLVTHRPKDKEKGVVSVTTGYTYKSGSGVTVTIGTQTFTLFTSGEHAFAEEGKDSALVNAMIRGADMVVKGTSSRGTLTTDTYSLKGFTAAWKAIGKACGY